MIEPGQIVRSIAGHDKDRFFLVLEIEGDFAYLVDGKYRPLESPKKKRKKHLAPTLRKFDPDCPLTDKKLRTALAELNGGSTATEGGSDLGKR